MLAWLSRGWAASGGLPRQLAGSCFPTLAWLSQDGWPVAQRWCTRSTLSCTIGISRVNAMTGLVHLVCGQPLLASLLVRPDMLGQGAGLVVIQLVVVCYNCCQLGLTTCLRCGIAFVVCCCGTAHCLVVKRVRTRLTAGMRYVSCGGDRGAAQWRRVVVCVLLGCLP